MAFVEGTRIFTDSGYKPIEDIAGHDCVLVRNFLGEAMFTQPFGIKKSKYNGDITEIAGKYWKITTTPDHIIEYDRSDKPMGKNMQYVPAKDVVCNPDNRIYRQFRYISPTLYKPESIVVRDDYGKTWKTIANEDWFVLCAFMLDRGYIEPTGRTFALNFYLKRKNRQKDLALLADILDRLGVTWAVFEDRTNDRWIVRVNNKNTLATKMMARLGSRTRRKMRISDKMIYSSSKDLVKLFIDQLFNDDGSYSTTSHQFYESLDLMCTLWGYNLVKTYYNGQYKLQLYGVPKTYSPTSNKTESYTGNVYEILLFDGQVLVKNGSTPIWVSPK